MTEKSLIFPNNEVVKSPQSYVIVGANGSGKSHLGAWIEKNNENVLRISAQRALSIPESIAITDSESAWKKIFYGDEKSKDKNHKWRWGKETSSLVDDYVSVLSSVFSIESDELRKYKSLNETGNLTAEYETIVDKILKIWNKVFPQRSLKFEKFEVNAEYNTESYKAGFMSDGERVGLYLIAQCLITPDDYTIVIDEPELHLHTSIMKRLWDEIERYCHNKTFVYITHDLRFATSRKTATKIWVKSYDGKDKWDFSIIDQNDEIPEALLLEVLGTRNPVLFVEGEKNSFDLALYKEVYENHHVIPSSSCQKVIEFTKAFNNSKVKSLHQNEIRGLIDHDFLTDTEIKSYKKHNILTLDVSEVENLFLIEKLVKIVADFNNKNPEEEFKLVSDYLFQKLESCKDDIINSICVKEIRHKLKGFKSIGKDDKQLQDDLEKTVSITKIEIADLYKTTESKITEIIDTRNYKELLKVFNHKGLCNDIGSKMKLGKKYQQTILDLMNTEKRDEILEALKEYLPSLS